MIGAIYSRLTVIRQVGIQNEKKLWECKCECGSVIRATTGSLRSGNTKSCGCLKRDIQTKHGGSKTRTYRIWRAMLNRCSQEQYARYYSHITVADHWKQYEAFLADMGEAPDGMTLDRRENKLGYSPENCRWASRTVQVRNTRRRKEFEHDGIRHSALVDRMGREVGRNA